MDKKILFKRIAATVSAVAVFALSFSMVSPEPQNIEVSAAVVDLPADDNYLNPFANLSIFLSNTGEFYNRDYLVRFDFPLSVTSFYDSGIAGTQYTIYDFGSNLYYYYEDQLTSSISRYLSFNLPSSFSSLDFVVSGESFFIPQRYFDLLFGTSFSGANSDSMVLSQSSGSFLPDHISFDIEMTCKTYNGQVVSFFDNNQRSFSLSKYSLGEYYRLKDSLLGGTNLSILDFFSPLSLDSFKFYSNDDIYYFIDSFSIHFYIGSQYGVSCNLCLNPNQVKVFEYFDSYPIYLKSYYDVYRLNSVPLSYYNSSVDAQYNAGYSSGYDIGYNLGYGEGASLSMGNFDVFATIVSAIADFLSFEILPNFTLGTLFLISFGAAFLFFVIKIFLGG